MKFLSGLARIGQSSPKLSKNYSRHLLPTMCFSLRLHFRFSVACLYAVLIYASVVNCSIFHSVKHLSFLSKCDSKERLLESYNVRHYSCTTFIVCIQLWASTITTQYKYYCQSMSFCFQLQKRRWDFTSQKAVAYISSDSMEVCYYIRWNVKSVLRIMIYFVDYKSKILISTYKQFYQIRINSIILLVNHKFKYVNCVFHY